MILVGAQGEGAWRTVERACATVAQSPMTHTPPNGQNIELVVTLSAGVACCREEESAKLLISRADRALYAAKQAGRNRVLADELLDGAGT